MKHVFKKLSLFLAGCYLCSAQNKPKEELTLEDPIDVWFPELKLTPHEQQRSDMFKDPEVPHADKQNLFNEIMQTW